MFEQFCLFGGIAVILYGIIKSFINGGFAFITIILGILLVLYHFGAKSRIEELIQKTIAKYEEKLENGKQIIRAIIAEIVDFRIEFKEKDAESQKVLDFFEQIKPEEYIKKLGKTERKII